MGAVASFVGDVVGDVVDVVGDVADTVVDVAGDAVQMVGNAVESTVEGALDDPIGTMAKVAAISTGQAYLLPVISASTTLANGGDLGDALKSGAITYAAGQVGGWVGDEVGAAANYGTDLGSTQTAMLAAQDVGMGTGNLAGSLARTVAGSATGAALSGGDINQAIMGGLAGLGTNLTVNAAGQVINATGDVIADSYDQFMSEQYGDQPGDYPTTAEELAAADLELAGIPSPSMVGDQPGDYPTTQEELIAGDAELAKMSGLNAIGDQPGDYPTTPEELAAADAQLATMPAAEQYADQPGDYDTTKEEYLASEEALAGIPDADSGLNTDGVKNYFTNQFTNNLTKELLGTTGLTAGTTRTSGTAGTTTDPFDVSGGAIQNLTPTLTKANQDYTLSGLPHMASGSTTNQYGFTDLGNKDSSYNPFAVSKLSYIKPGLTQANTRYDLLGLPGYLLSRKEGGSIPGHNPEFFSEGGLNNRYVKGRGDGTSDSIPAMLASGEFVIPADVVSGLGNGDNDAGAKVLDEFLKTIRRHKRRADVRKLPPDSKGPLGYLLEAKRKVR